MTEENTAQAKSCSTCPSFLGSAELEEQAKAYDAMYKAPTCPLKGKLLGGPHASPETNEKIQEAVARTCGSHGKTPPRSTTKSNYLTIALPMPTMPEQPHGYSTHDSNYVTYGPKSCRTCEYHIPGKIVQEEIGITSGLCAKRGIMIADQATTKVAKNCSEGSLLVASNTGDMLRHYEELLANVMILPELRPALKLGKRIGANMPIPEEPFVDPQDYPSDLPVTPEDQAHGIRAWRFFHSDEGDKKVAMPVFDMDFFEEDEQKKIPRTGDQNHPELYQDHQNLAFRCAVIWKMGETPALHGIAGTGKTEFFRYMAWQLGLPFERVSITESSDLDDLAGKSEYTPEKGTFFVRGRIPRAWAKPCVQVIDEPNVGKPAVWQFIRPMTDNAKQLVLDMNHGEVIDRHPHSYLGMAMNPSWDFRNIGAETISDADGSRLMHIYVDFPDEKLEREIIRKRCEQDGFKITPDQLTKVMQIAQHLRALSDNGTLPITWGIRQQIKAARALAWFSWSEAYRLAAADYIEPQARQLILDQVNLKA